MNIDEAKRIVKAKYSDARIFINQDDDYVLYSKKYHNGMQTLGHSHYLSSDAVWISAAEEIFEEGEKQ